MNIEDNMSNEAVHLYICNKVGCKHPYCDGHFPHTYNRNACKKRHCDVIDAEVQCVDVKELQAPAL